MIGIILVVIVILILLGGPYVYRGGPWSTYGSGGFGLVQLLLVVVLIVILLQAFHVF
jgi:hypothetical protein